MSEFPRVGKYSIHDKESLTFVRKLSPDPFVLETMEHGLLLDFVSEPGPYYEKNNKSCVENLQVAQNKVASWLEMGLVSETKTRPHCCSPISVSEKLDYLTGLKKKRPCLDLSRHVNTFIRPNTFKLEDLNVSEKLIEKDDYQVSWDLSSAYLHIGVNKKHRKYLGFSLPDSSGRQKYYVFNVMIFGIKSAVFVMTSLTWPLLSHLHKRGVRASIYIDDGRIVAETKQKATEHLKYALKLFENAGWNIQAEKTSTEPVKKLYHQGFFTDTTTMKYHVADYKIIHLKEQLQSVLETSRKCKLKLLASAAGKLMAAQRALGPVIPVCLRSTFLLCAESAVDGIVNYEAEIKVNEKVIKDLSFLLTNLQSLNGYPIFPSQVGYCLNQALEEGDIAQTSLELKNDEECFVSDASDVKAVSYNLNKKLEERISVHTFSTSQRELSSSAREFLAAYTTITRLHQDIANSGVHTLYWVTDSQVLAIWLRKGTRIEHIQRKLVDLFKLLHRSDIRLIPMWKPRENKLIQLADSVSKFRDTDDWGISKKGFRILEAVFKLKFSCDVFASSTNAKVPKFYSKVASPGSYGVNAFMMDWTKDICFVCPPVKEIIDTFRYIQNVPTVGVLVVPFWQRNPFWPIITEDGIHVRKEFIKVFQFMPTITTGEDLQSSSFQAGVRRRMMALQFDSRNKNVSSLPLRCTLGGCGICKD